MDRDDDDRTDAPTPEELAEANVALAKTIARVWMKKIGVRRLDDDIFSAALAGLWEAARGYDFRPDVMFHTYATRRIVGAILDRLREEEPKGYRRKGGRRQSGAPAVVSLDAGSDDRREDQFRGGRDRNWHEVVPDDAPPVGLAFEVRDEFERLLRKLPAGPCQDVMRRLYSDPGATMKAVGRAVGLSESRVSQINAMCLNLLRAELGVRAA